MNAMVPRARAATALALLALACGREPSGPPPALGDDARALELLLADDLVLLAVGEADDAVAEDLPVRAAERLRSGAIPAARRQVERARTLTLVTAEGRELRAEVVAALEGRQAALEGYADALERGLLEDLELARSLRTQREAEATIDALLARLQASRAPSTGRSR